MCLELGSELLWNLYQESQRFMTGQIAPPCDHANRQGAVN